MEGVGIELLLGLEGANETLNKVGTISSGITDKLSQAFNLVNIGSFINSIKEIASALKPCIEASSEYVENLNLMETAFGKTANSAKAFVNSLSGTFGLDESALTRQIGLFRQLGNSLMIGSEDADRLAKNLTSLQLDISSLYNLDFARSGEILQSALAGRTQSIRNATGADITEATLQIDLLNMGINKQVSELNRASKTVLIYESLARQLSAANGDLAKTINSPANQMKVFSEQCSRLARAIGNVLLPVVGALLPYLNAVLMVLTKLINTFAKFVGFDAESLAGTTKGIGDLGIDLDSAASSADNLSKSAAAAKKSLRGFDKLNVITTPTSGSGGGAGGLGGGLGGVDPELLAKLGDYDLGDVKNKAVEIADAIWGWITTLGNFDAKPLIDTFKNIKKDVDSIGYSLRTIFTSKEVTESAARMGEAFKKELRSIVTSVVTIGANIAEGLLGGFSQFLNNSKQNIIDDLTRAFDTRTAISEIISGFFDSIGDISSVFTKDNFKGVIENATGIFYELGSNLMLAAETAIKDRAELLFQPIIDNKDKIRDALDNTFAPIKTYLGTIKDFIKNTFDTIWKVYDESIKPALDNFRNGFSELFGFLLDMYNKYIAPVIDSVEKNVSDLWSSYIQPIVDDMIEIFGNVELVLSELYNKYIVPIIEWIGTSVIPILSPIVEFTKNTLITAFKAIIAPIKEIIGVLSGLIEFLTGIFTGNWDKAWKGISKIVDSVSQYFKDVINILKEQFNNTIDYVKGLFFGILDSIKMKLEIAVNFIKGIVDKYKKLFKDGVEFIKNNFITAVNNIKNFFNDLPRFFSDLWTKIKSKFTAIGKGIGETISNAFKDVINSVLNKVVEKINGFIKAINNAIKIINKIPGVNITKVTELRVPKFYKDGGFPEEGPFYMNQGEIAGKFNNGKTVVANNQQITEGIRQAARDGFLDAMMATGSNKQKVDVNIVAESDEDGLLNYITFKNKQKDRQYGL